MTLIEVLMSLPGGVRLSMSKEFAATVGTRMVYGTRSQAVQVVGQAKYGATYARLSGKRVEVYNGSAKRWACAFEVVR